MIETIEFKNTFYPAFQGSGFAARFIFPFAQEVCKGKGYDIGCNREEWKFPGAIGIDPNISGNLSAMNLPPEKVDYIFSSHCLEHLERWVDVLEYWKHKLKDGGVLFIYLPHPSQEYWLPWHNRKHINVLTPEIIYTYLHDTGWKNIFVGNSDLNNSFAAMAQK